MNVLSLAWNQIWSAPAKLNLCLHVLGQRQDGYHELETIFQLIDLCDRLQFTPRDDDEIVRLSGLSGIEPEQDLIVRAAQLLKTRLIDNKTAHHSQFCGVSIACEKHIPAQAGMGGGSSDAATTLVALNHLWQGGYSLSQLAEMGASLGADVPVFVYGYSAYARGIGEILEPVRLPKRRYLIVKPDIAISTGEVFQNKRLTRDTKVVTIRALLESMQTDSQVLSGHNDCEKVVCEDYPDIAQLIDFLNKFGDARLTGTGSSVFMLIADGFDIARIQQELSEKSFAQNAQIFEVEGLNRSPLLDELG